MSLRSARLDHVALNARDPARMLAFYTDTLGLAGERVDLWRRGEVPFPSVRLNESTVIDLFPESLGGERREARESGGTGDSGAAAAVAAATYNHLCIALSRAEYCEARERLRAAGFEPEGEERVLWGARGDARAVYYRDVERNVFELRYYDGGGNGGGSQDRRA